MSDSKNQEPLKVIESQLMTHGVYATNTSGVSMRPLFRTHRDVVILEKPKGELKKYDVVLYRVSDVKYVLHRIIEVKEDEYIIRGDNTFIKEHVPKDMILGVMTAFNRKDKKYTVSDRGYKIYSRFWNFIYPVRRLFYGIRRLLGKMYRKVFKK